ncbi:MAG: glycosyltransferase [Deltaproteobacteria bacterium]|nr:glycosyltransferase [Deltaproteobacteria bacterium]
MNLPSSLRPIKLSVVIPMYNEEANVSTTIARIKGTLKALEDDYEIIPVNDGSTDNTLKRLDEIAGHDPHVQVVSYWKNGGRGKALRYGFKAARGEYIATIDADLSYDPKYILDMVKILHEESDIDVVLISPYMKGGKTEGVPKSRVFISRLGNQILRLAMPEKVHTITCIARCYRRDVISALDLESNGKEIHLEVLSKVMAMGFRIKEIPATLTAREKGESKFAFRSTAVSHLLFTIFERPMLLFGLLGAFLTIIGLGIGVYIIALYYTGFLNPNRPLITFMILFILGGIQIFSFGFIASQVRYLRKEVLRIRRAVSKPENRISRSESEHLGVTDKSDN